MSKFSIAMLVWAVLSIFSPSDEGEQVNEGIDVASIEMLPPDTLELHPPLTPPNDTGKVKKNPNDRRGDATHQDYVSPLQLGNPGNFSTNFELADDLSGFNIYERAGKVDIRRPSFISYEDYLDYSLEKSNKDYFRDQALKSGGAEDEGLELNIDIEELSDIFGGGGITIRPTGFATLRFSIDRNVTENPALDQRSQRLTNFNFDQNIQLGVTGQIGNAMKLNVNFDTKATFDFENELKLGHKGTEDQILQEIQAGNVSMQVGNSLIQGRQNLFGLKAKMKFGPVMVSGIASMERGKVESLNVSGGGAVETPFEKEAVDYDANRHFFLSHFFRSRYEDALANLPIVQSTLRVNRVEVWVQQQGFSRITRNAVGLLDLGENDNTVRGGQGRVLNQLLTQSPDQQYFYPDNRSNNLYDLILQQTQGPMRQQSTVRAELEALNVNLENTEDFEILGNMRKLEPNEYFVNSQLGYVSLNTPLRPDQVLFVAFDYTLDNQVHQVGEFSQDIPGDNQSPNVLFLKMLKPSVLRVDEYPAWDLMMKNIYSVGYGMEADGFFLDLQFESGTKAGKINYLPNCELEGRPLIQILGLDRVTNNTSPGPDNYFDYIPNITVRSERGLVIFPTLEPFGDFLREQLGADSTAIENYVFDELYDRTQADAERYAPQYRYSIEGYYRSSATNEIPLNTFNLQSGSVIVSAGGRRLIENQDYRVDYFGGKIIITNPAILTSGQDIQVSYESSAMLQLQTKSLIGARAEYSPFKDVNIGATVLNLREQPLQQKTLLGEEPTANTLWGLDMNLNKESNFLTKAIDKLPLISTKETSNIQMSGEMAQFIPGVPGSIQNEQERGFVYIDDFEAATQPYPLMGAIRWQLAAYPEGNPNLYDPRVRYSDPLAINFSRSKLAWFQIDRTLYSRYAQRISDGDNTNNYTRLINFLEIFPEESRPTGAEFQQTFDLMYLPRERGPYNYQADASKLDFGTGDFSDPRENWAGISRSIDINNDFEANNVEFIEFWLMDPFDENDGNPNSDGGEMYINLGRISEEVIPDGFLTREHALPPRDDSGFPVDTTDWGIVGTSNPINNAFDSNPTARRRQDVGLDGLSSTQEAIFFNDVLSSLQGSLSPAAFEEFRQDPSSDDFVFYLDDQFPDGQVSILDRYADFAGLEFNSPIGDSTTSDGLVKQNTTLPNNEDINNNGSLNIAERYFEYRLRLHPDSLDPGENFVVDRVTTNVRINRGGDTKPVTWYQFRIPIREGSPVNEIDNFKTISFMRMYLTNWADTARLRFTEFQFVASQWIQVEDPLFDPNSPPVALDTRFELGQVSRNKNSNRQPFNFVLPPGIELQPIYGNSQPGIFQDERALAIQAENLAAGDARGIFKVTRQDLRQYDRLKMFVHAEQLPNSSNANFNQRGDATVFMRLGLDNDNNYYEYAIPLTPSEIATSTEYAEVVWPTENEFDIALSIFAAAKNQRDASGQDIINRYLFQPDSLLAVNHQVYVKGTPKLSDVRYIMIGVRNTRGDEQPISLELWVNELRTTNFNRKKGWAANLNSSVKLADLGTVNFSGAYQSNGFGPLEQKLSTRPLEDMIRYDVSANVALDKLLPTHWGVSAPVYATFGNERIRPVFNPREADVRTDELIETLEPREAREKIREIEDFRSTKSVSLNNWRIDPQKKEDDLPSSEGGRTPGRPGGPPRPGGDKDTQMPWDIANFDFSFAYSEKNGRDAVTEKQYETTYRGGVNYRYQFPQVSFSPFWFTGNDKFLGGKLSDLGNFMVNPLPTDISVSVDGNRRFEERIIRIFNESTFCADSLGHNDNDRSIFAKNFLLNRRYTLSWPLTNNLNIAFNAENMGRVDEVPGYWDESLDTVRQFIAERGTFGEQILKVGKDEANGHYQLVNFGRTIQYKHNINASYTLPTQQIKPLNWISANVNYTTTFDWMQAPEIQPTLGGTISNTQNVQGTGRLDLNSLYRKFKPLNKALSPKPPRPDKKKNKKKADAESGEESMEVAQDTEKDSTEVSPFLLFMKDVGREVVRLAFSLRSVDLNYSRNGMTIMPGYLPGTDNFGLDFGRINTPEQINSPITPPTVGFILGSQDPTVRDYAAQYGWITQDTNLTNPFIQNYTENITGQASLELFNELRIDLSINRNVTENFSEFFSYNFDSGGYVAFSPLETGSYSASYIFINTAFEPVDTARPNFSDIFNTFSEARSIISARYAAQNPETANLNQSAGKFTNGYLGTNQDVLLTSFLAAYGIFEPETIELNPRPRIPLPNWTINYNGLSKLPFLKEHFTAFSIRHGYRATYTVGNFNNNLNFTDFNGDGYADIPIVVDSQTVFRPYELINYQSRLVIQTVQMSEQFAPLLGISFNMKNGLQGQFEYKRGRQLSLNVGSLQLIEVRNQDLSVTMGFRKDKLNLFFRAFGRDINLDNSANFQFRLTMRDTREWARTLDPEGSLEDILSQTTRGAYNLVMNPAIDYVVNKRLNVRVFYEQNLNRPYTSNTFRTNFWSVGFQLRFTLAN